MLYSWFLNGETEVLGYTVVAISLLLVTIIIVLFIVFVKRNNQMVVSQQKAKEDFERELAETQIEIREETLRNISWELHDNIGQLLTLAKIQAQNAKDDPAKIEEAATIIGTGLDELRALSRLINPDTIKNLHLKDALQLEIDRFNRLNFIEATLNVKGEVEEINPKEEVIIFRILQEFFSNTIKHSKATTLDVLLTFQKNQIIIQAEDNGVGFFTSETYEGIGLENMKNRAKLIHSDLVIHSEDKNGTSLSLTYNYKVE